ncbi:MAG: GxxExxY protein [Patescibacteria group bacterium]
MNINRFDNDEYPEIELTRNIIGCAFEVYKALGYGLSEKTYQNALSESLAKKQLEFQREKYGFVTFNGKKVGKYYLDFLVAGKIAVELKVRNEIYETDVRQLLSYLSSEKIQVGLLIVFTKNGAKVKRLIK